MSRYSSPWASVPPPLPPPRHIPHGPEKEDQSRPDIAGTWKESGPTVMPSSSLYGSFPIRGRANTEQEIPSFTHYSSQSAASSYDASLLSKLDSHRENASTLGEGGGLNWSEQLRLRAGRSVSQSRRPSFLTSLSSSGKDESVLGKTSNNHPPMSLSLPITQSRPGLSDNVPSILDPGVYYQMTFDQFNSQMTQGLQHGSPHAPPRFESEEFIPTAIVIKNIPFAVKKEQLVALMSGMQLPVPYAINYHIENGVFRGLAFANFTDPEEARHVINAMNHMELQGRKLRVEHKKLLPAEERERIEREKREKRGQLERASSLPRHNHSSSLNRVGSISDLSRRQESVSRQSPVPGIYSGYAGSNHSSTSIRSYGSNNSYSCSVRSARGILDADSDNRFSGLERRSSNVDNLSSPSCLPPHGLPRRHSGDGIQNVKRAEDRPLERYHQTWERFCVLQLVAFLQICTLDDVHALTQSPTLLGERFRLYLKRMMSQEGNMDFLSYQASPRPGQPETQLQLLRHHKSSFSQSRDSIRSYSSRTSHSSASTASSFSSQISDGTLLNHVQQEAKTLKDCLTKIQKKLKSLETESKGTQSNKGQKGSAAESAPLTTAIELLHSEEGHLGLLGFSDMSLLFAKFHREFAAIYKDLKSLKRQNKFQKVLRPGRSKQEFGERHEKYSQIEQAARRVINETMDALEAAEAQKHAFIVAGRPHASISILESAAQLGYAPYDTFAGLVLETRQFLKIDDPQFRRYFRCECCPKKPKKFDTAEELRAHENEMQYECPYCFGRFMNKNEAERHRDALHIRRHSWSCAALSGHAAAFHNSPTCPDEADTCGYCGEDFERTGPLDSFGIKIASERDWEQRIEHLRKGHKIGECNQAKKFFRVDHFRQHLKQTHSGISGKWTNMLENACMKDELLPEPIPGLTGKEQQTAADG